MDIDKYPFDTDDVPEGGAGDNIIVGSDGYDKLYGGAGNDKLYGEGSYDDLYGGKGVDQLYGDTAYLGVEGNDGDGADYFYFDTKDSGDILDGKADTIHDFEEQDQIWLKGKSVGSNFHDCEDEGDGQWDVSCGSAPVRESGSF